MQHEDSDVHIRHFQSDTDAIQVCQMWVNGLDQTVSSKWWPTQPLWRLLFNHMAKLAVEENGDIGPSGQNIHKYWCEDKENRCMLVAEKKGIGGEISAPGKVVGCMAVVRGTNNRVTITPNSQEETFSVWKMSVARECRRNGIGGKLLKVGEEWAVAHGCKRMRMITANPVASQFYQSHGYELMCNNRLTMCFGGWHEKQI